MNNGKKEKLKLLIIIGTVSISITVFALFKFIDMKNLNESKYLLSVAIESLSAGEYEQAIKELERSLELNGDNNEAITTLDLAKECDNIEKAFEVENFMLVEEIMQKISKAEKFNLVEGKLNKINEVTKEKVKVMNEIDNLDVKIDEFILKKNFEEALKVIGEYLKKDINEEYKNKLNELEKKVNDGKANYDKEKERIEAEEKEREELLKSQGISKDEAKKSVSTNKYSDVGLNLVWSTSKTTKLDEKYYWIWGVDYESKPISKSLKFYVIVDIKTGKATEITTSNAEMFNKLEKIRKGIY